MSAIEFVNQHFWAIWWLIVIVVAMILGVIR